MPRKPEVMNKEQRSTKLRELVAELQASGITCPVDMREAMAGRLQLPKRATKILDELGIKHEEKKL